MEKLTGLDKIHAAADRVVMVAELLDRISEAFFQTGNEMMSKKLNKYSTILFEAHENIEKGVSEKIHGDFAQAQEASANILKACLAVNEDNRKEKKK